MMFQVWIYHLFTTKVDSMCTLLSHQRLGVHRNRYCKIRPEPELARTDEKFRPELPAGTGTL